MPSSEEEDHGREPQNRLGPDRLHPGRADDGVLDGNGDEGFHVVGGKARRLRLDLHPGRGELREDVHGGVPKETGPQKDKNHREGDDDESEAQGQPDDGTHQWAVPNSVLYSSAAPTTTTDVPGAGPRVRTANPSTTSLTSTRRRV